MKTIEDEMVNAAGYACRYATTCYHAALCHENPCECERAAMADETPYGRLRAGIVVIERSKRGRWTDL